MVSSTAQAEEEDKPITVRLGGYKQPFQIKAYNNPGDVELVYLCNNDMGRKRLGTVDEKDQTCEPAKLHGIDRGDCRTGRGECFEIAGASSGTEVRYRAAAQDSHREAS